MKIARPIRDLRASAMNLYSSYSLGYGYALLSGLNYYVSMGNHLMGT